VIGLGCWGAASRAAPLSSVRPVAVRQQCGNAEVLNPLRRDAVMAAVGVGLRPSNFRNAMSRHLLSPNDQVSDGSQPLTTFDLSLSESPGSRSLHRRAGRRNLAAGRTFPAGVPASEARVPSSSMARQLG
jgi:hypothetical protein